MVIECKTCRARQELIEQPLIRKNGAIIGAVSYCGRCTKTTVHSLVRTTRGQQLLPSGRIVETTEQRTVDFA